LSKSCNFSPFYIFFILRPLLLPKEATKSISVTLMNSKNFIAFLLTFTASLFGQEDNAESTTETLEEIAVEGASIPELDLSRSSILQSESIESRQVQSLGDLNGLSPNLHLSGSGIKSFGDVLTMRGIGNTQFFGSPGVQMYVDGVPQGNVFSYGSDLYNLEAVEILKGPQGSRFGKLAPGGAINLITRKPGLEQSSKVSASYATFNTQKYNLSSSGPLDEGFSYTMGIQRSVSDGFLNNSAGRNNDSESLNGRLAFYWDGGAGTKATLGASFTSHKLGAQPVVLRDSGDFYDRSVDFDESTEIDQNQQFLSIEHETTWGKLLLSTNRNDWDMNPSKLDIDLSTSTGATSTIQQNQNNWGQEIILKSHQDEGLIWNVGTNFHSNDISGIASRWYVFPYPEDTLVPNLGSTFTLTPNANRGNVTEPTTFNIGEENIAFFASFEKEIYDKISIEIGLRYDRTSSELKRDKISNYDAFTFSRTVNPNLVPLGFDVPSPATSLSSAPLRLSKDDSLLTSSIQINHTLSEISTSFLRFSNSGKPGGYSAFTDNAVDASFEKEKTLSYEIGFNYSPSSNLTISLSGFLNDVKDYQMEMPETGSTNYNVLNIDEVNIYGIELESKMDLEGGWKLAVSFGLSDSEIKDVTDLSSGSPSLVNLKNEQVSFVPKYTLSTMLGHVLNNGIYYQLGTRTVGESHFWDQTGVNDNDKIDSYTLLDARIGNTLKGWRFEIFGSNLTNEEYYTSLVSSLTSLGSAPGIAGSPRVVGLSISKEF
jgi:iron complex outermembrane receptor protein